MYGDKTLRSFFFETFEAAIMAASSSLRLVFFLIVLMKSTNASLFTRPFLKKLSSDGNMP